MGTSASKESVLDVLSRMKTELKFDVEDLSPESAAAANAAGEASKKPVAAPVAKEPKPPAPAFQEPSPSETVEELTNYMGDLLKRYGKGGAAPANSAPAAPNSPSASNTGEANAPHHPDSPLPQRKPRPAKAESTDPAPAAANEKPEVDPNAEPCGENVPSEFCLLEQREFIPRKRAPEEKACIDAMRELAVHSARRAIQTCDNKKRGFDAKHRLFLAFGAFAVSGVAFVFADSPFSVMGCVAMCGVTIGCMFIVNWQKTVALLKKSANS
ncbi:MAG: hypothetical protein JNL67_02000 [Planctomycetaceae bacterium]|nr:hypothetical protein [Planctomycetaceae bacterium]